MRAAAVASAVLLGLLPASAAAQAPPASPAPPPEKNVGLGLEGQLLVPLGDLADKSGLIVGPLVRFGAHVVGPLELTVRSGFLAGLPKNAAAGERSQSIVPLWAGARVFFLEPTAGPYVAGELALNLVSTTVTRGGVSSSQGAARLGFDGGIGWVISKDVPIDLRAQFTTVNLLLREHGEETHLAAGLSAGYTFQL